MTKNTNAEPYGRKAGDVHLGRRAVSRAGGNIEVRTSLGDSYVGGTLIVENASETDDDEIILGGFSYLVKNFENASGGSLALGTVVIIQADGTVTTTTTPQDTSPVGVVQATTADGDQAPIILVGYAAQINTNASVTAGNYAETSTDAGEAAESAFRRIGSFAQFLSTGTNPSGYLFGVTDSSGAGAGAAVAPIDHGNMGATETIDIDDGTWHRGTLDANVAITVTGFAVDEGLTAIVKVQQNATGNFGITWDTDVVFTGDDQPDQDPNAVTYYLLWSDEGDATIYGAKVGSSSSSGSGTTDSEPHVHVASEAHLSNGSTGTHTLDNAFEPNSVIAWNTTSLARLTVTEVQPDQATVSPVGTSGDAITFDYAATLV